MLYFKRLQGSNVLGIDLEAFAVDDGWTRLIILLLADPHLLEG